MKEIKLESATTQVILRASDADKGLEIDIKGISQRLSIQRDGHELLIIDKDGNVHGNLIGNVRGDVQGNLIGDVTGYSSKLKSGTPINAVASSLSTALAGDNNNLIITAKTKGAAGDLISISYVDPGANSQSLDVSLDGTKIVINLATDENGDIITTAGEIMAAIEADEEINALVAIENKAENDGTGIVSEMEEANLSNGVDGTIGEAGDIVTDENYIYQSHGANTMEDANWKRIAWNTF